MHEGGCKDFFLRRFVLSGPEVLKIEFSYRQWIDIHTKKKPKSKSQSETEVSSHLRKNTRIFRDLCPIRANSQKT